MGFKMTGMNFGKGTGSSKGFPEVGTHTTNTDGSVTWTPSDEYKKRLNKTSKVEVTKEDPLGITKNQRRIYNEAKTKIIKAIQKAQTPPGYSQWLKDIAQYGGNEGAEFLYKFVEPVMKMDPGSRKMNRFYNKLDKILGDDGKLNTEILNNVYKQMRIDQDPTDRKISYHNPHTGRVDLSKIKGQVSGVKMRYDESYEGPGVDMTLKGKQYTQEELDELAEIERETGIPAFDPADTNKDDYVSPEERSAYENMMAEKSGEGDGENVAIGSGENDDDASLDVDNKKDEFDPADTNKDNYVDKWERKDFEKLQKQQNKEVTTEDGGEGDGEGNGNEGDKKEKFDPMDMNKDGYVDKWDKKEYEKMMASKEKSESSMTKWNNKKMEDMAKETLMNADKNPFKYGSKEHEEYTNNKSRAKGLAIKRMYNKFL
tara:strand:+ start:207 stop:1490 length:1284 start_codon:yes stop_codon:yes gene_type:complete